MAGTLEVMIETGMDMAVCLGRVRGKDEEASRWLITHLYPLVIKIVRSHLPKRTDEEDLAQMVFVKMFTHIDQYRGDVPIEHWVSRIAVNTCLNQLRSEKNKPEFRWADLDQDQADVLEKVLLTSTEPAPSERLAVRELVQNLLDQLSPTDRLVITLLDLEERSVEEIRSMTGWNASLIKVRAFRARHKLRKHLAKLKREELP